MSRGRARRRGGPVPLPTAPGAAYAEFATDVAAAAAVGAALSRKGRLPDGLLDAIASRGGLVPLGVVAGDAAARDPARPALRVDLWTGEAFLAGAGGTRRVGRMDPAEARDAACDGTGTR